MTTKVSSENLFELNIAAIAARTCALGPGVRAAVWVQGCPFSCRGCTAPQWIPFTEAMKMTPGEVLARLNLTEIGGLTLSGGEPMQQAAGLAELVRLARQEKYVDVICFTGYRFEQLLKNPPNRNVGKLLAQIDVLIDGPYVESLNDSVGLRGSSNQRIIHLTSRLKSFDFESYRRKVEVKIRDGEMEFVGIPTREMTLAMEELPEAASERRAGNERV